MNETVWITHERVIIIGKRIILILFELAYDLSVKTSDN